MIIFADGRVIVGGTKDPALAKSLVAKYWEMIYGGYQRADEDL